MIDAGLPLVQGLEILATQQENYHFKKVLLKVKEDVETGKTFADALRQHGKVFDPLFVNLVAAGETGGILDTIMSRLAGAIEKQVALQKQVKGALVYPISIMGVAGIAVAVLMLFVVPVFEKMFADFGGELPGPTKMVIDFSRTAQSYWWVAALVFMAGHSAFSRYQQQSEGQAHFRSVFLSSPDIWAHYSKSGGGKIYQDHGNDVVIGCPNHGWP